MSKTDAARTSKHAPRNERTRDREWPKLYRVLRRELKAFGRNNAFGKGDFLLVEDDYGIWRQQVCITRIEALTPRLVERIQSILCEQFPYWSVVLALEIKIDGELIPDEGIEVFAERVDTRWDLARMKATFGDRFAWP